MYNFHKANTKTQNTKKQNTDWTDKTDFHGFLSVYIRKISVICVPLFNTGNREKHQQMV